jgi:hypothetical protein
MLPILVRPLLVLILLFGQSNSPDSAPLHNDHFSDAESISVLPFTAFPDISSATLEPDEPQYCGYTDRTVWYAFTPSETTIVFADPLGSFSTIVNIFEASGPGITGLVPVQCAVEGGPATFKAEAGKTYYIQVGVTVGEAGTVQFSLSEIRTISGRVIDAATGAALPGDMWPYASATLYKVCGEGCLESVSSSPTDAEGRFWLTPFPADQPGIYFVQITANLYPSEQFGPFEYNGEDVEIGDLALDPLAKIRSIRGRLLDRATGKPVHSDFLPVLALYRCIDGFCSELVNLQAPDKNGNFLFDTDSYGNQLPAGLYQIEAYGDQYRSPEIRWIEVGEGQSRNVGTLRLQSFPVRFSAVKICDWISPEGGDCVYSMRVWNGLGTKFEGSGWSIANTALPDSVIGFTNFQVNEPQALSMAPGESRVLRFRLRVPAGGASSETGICLRVFIGRGANAFVNTLGFLDLFCVFQGGEGFTITSQDSPKAGWPFPAKRAEFSKDGLEVEPNNSCQEAQDVGAVPFPFSINGNLDSSQSPDIDFYRFTATAGEQLRIDHQGQLNGMGTLYDPLLGVFDSGCNLIAFNDDDGNLDSGLVLTVPADGVFTLAATEYPDDSFLGGGHGTYLLTVSHFQTAGTISGRVTDAVSDAPLPGDAPPYVVVGLVQCNPDCVLVNSLPAGSDGSFQFAHNSNGSPLTVGDYRVVVVAQQYQLLETEQFHVGEDEHLDIGDLSLTPWRVQVRDAQVCAIPSEGGLCEYTVTVANPMDTRFSGKAWSFISGNALGTFVDFTSFQTATPLNLRLEPGAHETLHFRFRVRGAVPDGAVVCSEVYVGENPHAYFKTVGGAALFCAVKGPSGLSLMAPEETQAKLWQLQLQKLHSNPTFTEKKR